MDISTADTFNIQPVRTHTQVHTPITIYPQKVKCPLWFQKYDFTLIIGLHLTIKQFYWCLKSVFCLQTLSQCKKYISLM